MECFYSYNKEIKLALGYVGFTNIQINFRKRRVNTIIHYDQKHIWKMMCYTCRKKYLEYRGPYQLRILKKAMPMPAPGYDAVPIFYVETDDHRYHGMMEVTPAEYEKGKFGEYYGKGGVICYTKKEDCYYMSKYDDSTVAIRKAVNWAKNRLIFLTIVLLIVLYPVILLLEAML